MIKTKKELRDTISVEWKLYKRNKKKDTIVDYFTKEPRTTIWKYQKLLRKTEYYYNNKVNPVYAVLYIYYRRRKNILGTKLGIEIWENSFDAGLCIHHAGNIVINGKATIGKNCQLHGDNCIGNLGKTLDAPQIGNNVDIGVGAKILGPVKIADNVKIGAGAVVVKSCLLEGATLVGVPARIIGK